MKIRIVISFIVLSGLIGVNCNSVKYNFIKNDTFFLKREIRNFRVYHVIYIDTTKNATNLNLDFSFNNTDSKNINWYLNELKKRDIKLKKFDTYGLSDEWVPVYMLKSKYYTYKPSEGGAKRHRIISDSLLYYHWMDGYGVAAIKSFDKIDDLTYIIKSDHNDLGGNPSYTDLNIYIIDKQKMLSLFEYKTKGDEEYNYQLVVPRKFAHHFPLIINSSDYSKQMEVEFDTVDFKKLIMNYKN